MNRKPPGIGVGNLRQSRRAALVTLDDDNTPRAFHEQPARETSGPWTDLYDGRRIERRGEARDTARQIEIENEILTEALLRIDLECGDHLAQRWQAVARSLPLLRHDVRPILGDRRGPRRA